MMRNNTIGASDLLSILTGVIIAVVGILIFLGAVWSLWEINVSQEEESAKTVLTTILDRIDALEVGEENTFTFQGIAEWQVVAWDKGESGAPGKCALSSCICICPVANQQSCQESGICSDLSEDRVGIYSSVAEGTMVTHQTTSQLSGPTVTIFNEGAVVSCVGLPPNLFELSIMKEEDAITIRHSANEAVDLGVGYACIRESVQ